MPNYCMLSTMGRGYFRSLWHREGKQRKGRRILSAQWKNDRCSPFLRQIEPVMWLSYFLYLFLPGSKGEPLDVQFSLPRGRLSGHYWLLNYQNLQVVHVISCFVSSSGKSMSSPAEIRTMYLGACMGTLGLLECQRQVLYVEKKR